MENYYKNNLEVSIKLLTIVTIVYFLNILATTNDYIGLLIGITGYSIVFILLIINKTQEAALAYLLFLSTSIEMQEFVFGYNEVTSNLYSFLKLPVVGVYLIFIFNLALFVKLYHKRLINFEKFKYLKRLYMWSWIILLMGIVMMLITLLFNDNNITTMSWYYDKLKSELFRVGMIFFTIQNFIGMLIRFPDFADKLEKIAVHILIAMVPASLLTIVFGLHGYYGTSSDVLLMPLLTIFGGALVLFSFYTKRHLKFFYIITGVLFIVIMLSYTSPLGGKWILILMSIPIVLITNNFRSKNLRNYLYGFLFIILGIAIIRFLPDFFGDNSLLSRKFEQVKSLLIITEKGWYANLSDSPKFRIDEFINIIIEYYKKPYYLLSGKGHGGTIMQHTTTLIWHSQGAFSADEVASGVYFRLHESLNLIFLKYGVVGVFFFLDIISISIKHSVRSKWLIVGLIWFALFYASYTTLLFGAVVMVLGFYQIDKTRGYDRKKVNL